MLSFLRERVIHVQLYGAITEKTTDKLARVLKSKHFYDIQLIAVSINSYGGMIVQAKNISDILKRFSYETHAPVFTFAEDTVLGVSNIILTSGNKVFANKYSIIGDFGFYNPLFNLKDFTKHWHLNPVYVHAGLNKVRLNPYEEFKNEDLNWYKNLLLNREDELKQEIINNRAHGFAARKLTNEKIEEDIFKKTFITTETAKELGYIDDIKLLDDILEDKYHGVKVLQVMKTNSFSDSAPRAQNTTNEVAESIENRMKYM